MWIYQRHLIVILSQGKKKKKKLSIFVLSQNPKPSFLSCDSQNSQKELISSFHFTYSFLFLFFRFLGNQTNKARELEKDEASGGNGGIEQDAEVSSGGSGQTVPPQALQSLCQANLKVHGPRRARPVQHRRPRKLFLTKTQKHFFDWLISSNYWLIDKIKSKIFRFDWTHQGHWARISVGLLLKSLRKLEFINRLPKPPLKHPLPPKVYFSVLLFLRFSILVMHCLISSLFSL